MMPATWRGPGAIGPAADLNQCGPADGGAVVRWLTRQTAACGLQFPAARNGAVVRRLSPLMEERNDNGSLDRRGAEQQSE
jgi:hypothetical protein